MLMPVKCADTGRAFPTHLQRQRQSSKTLMQWVWIQKMLLISQMLPKDRVEHRKLMSHTYKSDKHHAATKNALFQNRHEGQCNITASTNRIIDTSACIIFHDLTNSFARSSSSTETNILGSVHNNIEDQQAYYHVSIIE